jgi:LysM repeat protein
MSRKSLLFLISFFLSFLSGSCNRPADSSQPWRVTELPPQAWAKVTPSRTPLIISTRLANQPISTPTPDPTRILPTPRTKPDEYVVQPNDTLGLIAQKFNVSLDALIAENKLKNPNQLQVGQVLKIPVPELLSRGPAFKIIPDSELVNGPALADFDIESFVKSKKGYLSTYQEEVEGVSFSGVEIIERVTQDYSVGARILLAVLEYQSGWVTQASPPSSRLDYPMGVVDPRRKGLYLQLTWTASYLNYGYYYWRVNAVSSWTFTDGSVVPIANGINAGTAGVQKLFSLLYSRSDWERIVTETGIFSTYSKLFGYPHDYAIDPLIPRGLTQPPFQLPFEPGAVWSYTGGPHAGWGLGSAWAAIDFAPPGDALGCVQSNSWVVAVTGGLITRANRGAVIQDLDSDGIEQTGWTVLYMHIESRDRVTPGTYLKPGQRVGHPSCEGGVSTGTHVHIARRYNGEWISADGSIPLNLEGWIVNSSGGEYDGVMVRDGHTVEAWNGRKPENQIQR